MTSFYFDTRDYTPEPSSFDPLPKGEYPGMIVKAMEKTSQTSGNTYASLEIEIVEGKYKGRKVYDNLFLHSTNATAQNIARAKLHGIATSLDLTVINSEEDFTFKPLSVAVDIDKDGKNQVKRYNPKQSAIHPAAFTVKETAVHDSVPF
jgi:hypothetical protein